ncbi:hypothetical protein EYC84_006261 [Monilinia fructicola]|uniref:Cyclin-like domain-containing protein n=1 Tax=Monilinia fructicola TaxID=38448 RepID=A0A5M9K6K3_MONFR|nr:hypothetical protein EYC84_006261 [Monilinia fructicola]
MSKMEEPRPKILDKFKLASLHANRRASHFEHSSTILFTSDTLLDSSCLVHFLRHYPLIVFLGIYLEFPSKSYKCLSKATVKSEAPGELDVRSSQIPNTKPPSSNFKHVQQQRQQPRQDSQEIYQDDGSKRQEAMANELSRQACDAYMDDIIDHMASMEEATMPDVASIEIQQEIQWFMRPYLIDFLIEAHSAFQLLPETLHLAVNLLDRYCSRRVVYKRHYQLVGCAALLIAAKYGDKKEPLSRDILGCPEMDTYGQVDSDLMLSLSRQLNQPSSVLARKYASPHLSKVSEILRRFLLQQAAMSQCHVTPPTPPAEPAAVQKPMQQHDVYSTPQKVYGQHVINGYLTPPITPEGEYFGPGTGNEMNLIKLQHLGVRSHQLLKLRCNIVNNTNFRNSHISKISLCNKSDTFPDLFESSSFLTSSTL